MNYVFPVGSQEMVSRHHPLPLLLPDLLHFQKQMPFLPAQLLTELAICSSFPLMPLCHCLVHLDQSELFRDFAAHCALCGCEELLLGCLVDHLEHFECLQPVVIHGWEDQLPPELAHSLQAGLIALGLHSAALMVRCAHESFHFVFDCGVASRGGGEGRVETFVVMLLVPVGCASPFLVGEGTREGGISGFAVVIRMVLCAEELVGVGGAGSLEPVLAVIEFDKARVDIHLLYQLQEVGAERTGCSPDVRQPFLLEKASWLTGSSLTSPTHQDCQLQYIKQQPNYRRDMDQSALNFVYFLAVIGGAVFILWAAKILWSLIKAILPPKNFSQRYGRGSWAVVTGGSDGIGLGFCQELALLGFNICIIARNRTKMESALAALRQLDEEGNIQTKCIVADFLDSSRDDFFAVIGRQLEGLDVSMLVNNVGVSNIGHFHELSQKRLKDEILVNVLPMTLLTHRLLPGMLARDHRSAVITISSVAGEYPVPYLAVYSATKAYNDFLSQSLDMEYAHKVDVLSVRPMLVETNLSGAKQSCTVASTNQCVQASLKYLGLDCQTNGYYVHRLLSYLTTLLPTPLLRCVTESESRKVMQADLARVAGQ